MSDPVDFSRVRASSLASLEHCPRFWVLEKDKARAKKVHDDLEFRPKTYKTIFGSLVHQAVEENLKNKELKKAAKDLVAEVADDADHPDFWDDNYTSVADLVKGTLSVLRQLSGHWIFRNWKEDRHMSKIEIAGEAELDGGMTLTGKIDCIDPQNRITDLKTTGRMKGTWHGAQLGAYHIIANEREFDPDPKANIVKLLRPSAPDRKTAIQIVEINAAAQKRHVMHLIKAARDIRDTEHRWETDYAKLPSNPSTIYCNFCAAKCTSACPESYEQEVA